MAVGVTEYSDITREQTGYLVGEFLKVASVGMPLEVVATSKTLPEHETTTIRFRRWEKISLETTPTPIVEGVTQDAVKMTYTDYSATPQQFGKLVKFTDKDTIFHQDEFLPEWRDRLTQHSQETWETLRWNVVKAGTTVQYTNGTARTDVNTVVDLTDLRKVVRTLRRQNAERFTSVLKATPNYDTHPIPPCYIAVCHPDMVNDLKNLPGFTEPQNYGPGMGMTGQDEIGYCEGIRFLVSTIFTAFTDAGGTAGSTVITTGGSSADVYPIIVFGKNAYFTIAVRGKGAIRPFLVMPKPGVNIADPAGQRGALGYIGWYTSLITNDSWMVRLETAATAI